MTGLTLELNVSEAEIGTERPGAPKWDGPAERNGEIADSILWHAPPRSGSTRQPGGSADTALPPTDYGAGPLKSAPKVRAHATPSIQSSNGAEHAVPDTAARISEKARRRRELYTIVCMVCVTNGLTAGFFWVGWQLTWIAYLMLPPIGILAIAMWMELAEAIEGNRRYRAEIHRAQLRMRVNGDVLVNTGDAT